MRFTEEKFYFRSKARFIWLFLLLAPTISYGAEDLLYLEAQGVGGYSSAEKKVVHHSADKDMVMQKNSVGFDYVKKLSTATKEVGTLALQARTAYDDAENKVQLQIYNAYTKIKTSGTSETSGTSPGNFWLGHNRTAFGLGSYFSTHGHLLQPLSMEGFGFDRDWGAGYEKDTKNGDVKLALTTGSGMSLRTNDDSWLATSRVSKGILNSDNYTIGFSAMRGKSFDVMGYKILDHMPKEIFLLGTDLAFNTNNIEHKMEIDFGKRDRDPAFAALYRIGFNFLEEDRLKFELQTLYTKKEETEKRAIDGGISYIITADLTGRFMYERSRIRDSFAQRTTDNRFIFQLYYYFKFQ